MWLAKAAAQERLRNTISMCFARLAHQTIFTGTVLRVFSQVCAIHINSDEVPCNMSKVKYLGFSDCNIFQGVFLREG